MKKKKILAISGSIQEKSVNTSVITYISRNYSSDIIIDRYSDIDKLPHFNPDLDTDNPPKIIQNLRQNIENADGILICTPEYVFSLPGVLKNLIDWNVSSPVFINKNAGLIVAAASGHKAMESLDLIMNAIQANVIVKLTISGAKGKIGRDGTIHDQLTRTQINDFITQFIQSI